EAEGVGDRGVKIRGACRSERLGHQTESQISPGEGLPVVTVRELNVFRRRLEAQLAWPARGVIRHGGPGAVGRGARANKGAGQGEVEGVAVGCAAAAEDGRRGNEGDRKGSHAEGPPIRGSGRSR